MAKMSTERAKLRSSQAQRVLESTKLQKIRMSTGPSDDKVATKTWAEGCNKSMQSKEHFSLKGTFITCGVVRFCAVNGVGTFIGNIFL